MRITVAAGCIRFLFVLGPKKYIKERVLLYRVWPWAKNLFHKIYDSLLHLNPKDDTTKSLIKIVLINFIILGFISLMWFWGIAALIVYSIALFLLLRKYSNDLKNQYNRLLDATNQLAEGNLNGTIPEDLGIFEPFREEIVKIQTGFRKAVDEVDLGIEEVLGIGPVHKAQILGDAVVEDQAAHGGADQLGAGLALHLGGFILCLTTDLKI